MLITALVAISYLFAMGGSTVIAIRLGRGDKKGANDAFMTAFIMTLFLSVVLLLIGTLLLKQIAMLCGSSQTILPMAKEYLFYYTLFSTPFLLSNCLSVFVRNDGAPGLSFAGMCFPVKYAGYCLVLQLGFRKYPWRYGGLHIQCAFIYLFGCLFIFCQQDLKHAYKFIRSSFLMILEVIPNMIINALWGFWEETMP